MGIANYLETDTESVKRMVMRRVSYVLPLAAYVFFFWRSVYAMRSFPLYVLDLILVVVGLVGWSVVGWARRRAWPRTSLDFPLLAWCAVTAWATIFSFNLRGSLHGLWDAWTLALIFWLIVDFVRRGWSRVLWRLLYLLGGVVCIIGVTEFLAWYFGWPLLPGFQQGWYSIGGLADPIPPVLHRLSLALANATALSAFIALLIPPAICILIASRDREARWGMLIWLVVAGLIELFSLSRGGLLALGISIPLILVGSSQSPQVRQWWRGLTARRARILLIVGGGGALAIALMSAFWMVSNLAVHDSGDAVRMDLWRSAVAMLRDHPFTGVGSSAFGTQLRLYRDPNLARDHITTAHNIYLNTAAEMGILGLLAGAWLAFTLARAWWRQWRTQVPGGASWWRLLGMGAALAGLAAQSMVDTFVEPAVVLPAIFFAAQILAWDVPADALARQPRRWPWLASLAVLLVGALGMSWDGVGYAYFARSLASTQRGDIGTALSAGERAVRHDPGIPLYTCHLGYLHGLEAAQGNAQALSIALQQYDKCLAHTPVPGWVDQMNWAVLQQAAGQMTQAGEMLKAASEQNPFQKLVWLNRGVWAESMGEHEMAVSSYRRVLELDPRLAGSPFWQHGERVAILNEILSAEEQDRTNAGGGYPSWRWQVMIAAGQWEAVVREIEGWLETHPHDTGAMALLGETLLDLGRPAEALVWIDRVWLAQSASTQAYVLHGEAALALGRYTDAERAFRTAVFLDAGNIRAHLGLARWAKAKGDVDTALYEYRQALRPQTMTNSYNYVLYRRPGWPVPLPQVVQIGYRQDAEVALEWGNLLEEEGDVATAQLVYAATLSLDPFVEEVRERVESQAPR